MDIYIRLYYLSKYFKVENWNILSTLIEDKKDDIFLVKCKIDLNWFYKI